MRTIVDVVPTPLLVFAVVGAVVGIVLVSVWAVRRWIPAIAVIVGFSLVVLVALQFPFSGGLAVDPTPFKEGGLAQFFAPSK